MNILKVKRSCKIAPQPLSNPPPRGVLPFAYVTTNAPAETWKQTDELRLRGALFGFARGYIPSYRLCGFNMSTHWVFLTKNGFQRMASIASSLAPNKRVPDLSCGFLHPRPASFCHRAIIRSRAGATGWMPGHVAHFGIKSKNKIRKTIVKKHSPS